MAYEQNDRRGHSTVRLATPPHLARSALGSELRQTDQLSGRVQDSFERRVVSAAYGEPLISTPLTIRQLKVLTMIAIDPESDGS
mgnify:CR=1 FL=1